MNNIISLFKRHPQGLFGTNPEQSFESIMAPHMDSLYRQAYQYTGSAMEAEDLIQDLLVDLLAREHALREIGALRPWLKRCLYHRFVDQYRSRQRRPVQFDSEVQERTAEAGHGPEDSYWHQQVVDGLQSLSPEQRAVLSLHDIQGHTLPALSELLDIPLGTLKSQLHRGRKNLKSHLQLQPSGSETRSGSNHKRREDDKRAPHDL